MRRKRAVDNLQEEEERMKPACEVCIHRKGCEHYAENTFCTRFASREPERYGDPNELWERGEEVDF